MLAPESRIRLLVVKQKENNMKRIVFPLVIVATLGVYFTMLLWSLPNLSEIAGGLKMFDLRPGGYSLAQAQEIVANLGEAGRVFYLGTQHKLDTAYPLLLALTLAMSFVRLFGRKVAVALILLAALAAGFDLLENITVAEMLRTGPAGPTTDMAAAASRWTFLKSVASSLAFLALLLGLGLAWRRRYSGKASRQLATESRASS